MNMTLPSTLSADMEGVTWYLRPPRQGISDEFAVLGQNYRFPFFPVFTTDRDVGLDEPSDYQPSDGWLGVTVVAFDMEQMTLRLRVHTNTLPGVSVGDRIVDVRIEYQDEGYVFCSIVKGLTFDGASLIEWVPLLEQEKLPHIEMMM